MYRYRPTPYTLIPPPVLGGIMSSHTENTTLSLSHDGVSRRQFIQGSAAIAGAFGITLTQWAEAEEKRREALQENRPVNVAFIGVGDQGYNVDFKAAMSVPGVK